MTEKEAKRLCLAAMKVDRDLAYAVVDNAAGAIQHDAEAIRQLQGLAERRLYEAEHFPLSCHALRALSRAKGKRDE